MNEQIRTCEVEFALKRAKLNKAVAIDDGFFREIA